MTFNVSGTPAAARRIAKYELDFTGDGGFHPVAPGLAEHRYRDGKLYAPRLRVTDDRGAVGTESLFLDLVDVSIMGLSCRVVFPGDGDVVSGPRKVSALASNGPGKRLKETKLYLDDRLIATGRLPHVEADVAWRALPPGEHAVRIEAFDLDGRKAIAAAKFTMSGVFGLWPENGEVITGTRVVVTWFSPEAAETAVDYRRAGETDWHRDAGARGQDHKVVLDSVEAGVAYEFRAGDGTAFRGDLPEGHYAFPIPPRAIRFPGDPETDNTIEIKSEHLRGGHYVVTSDFQVVYRLTEVDTFVIAESREAAEKKVYDAPGFRFKGMDLGVNSNDLSISKKGELSPGDKVEITANLQNLGMDPGKDVTVALLQTPMGSGNAIEVARVTLPDVPLYGPLPVKFPWSAVPGERVLRVVIDPDKALEENTRFNNEALLTVKVSGKDNPPQLEVALPEDGSTFDSPKVGIEMRGIDESGISLLEYRIDGGLWTARKGVDRIAEKIVVQPGAHTLHFRATDCSGNQATASRQISVTCARPAVAIEAPAEGAALPHGRVAVTVRVNTSAGIKGLEARAADGAWKAIDLSSEETVTFDLAMEPGRQALEVKVTDIAGVEAVASRTVEIAA